jgi:hypothetical protein
MNARLSSLSRGEQPGVGHGCNSPVGKAEAVAVLTAVARVAPWWIIPLQGCLR